LSSTIDFETTGAVLAGDLVLVDGARGVALFAHGSGSSRHSPRNKQVAAGLNDAGLATLLIDLLTASEEEADVRTGQLRFDVPLLASRLTAAVDWLAAQPTTASLPVGLFGASTGAAAALVTAAARASRVRAVVSRGGRPDLAGDALTEVGAPVLLIVGGSDTSVLELNEQAGARIARHELSIVPGATHLFEEPGALESVTALAANWFNRWIS